MGAIISFEQLSERTRIRVRVLWFLAVHGELPAPLAGDRHKPSGVIVTPALEQWIGRHGAEPNPTI